MAGTALGSVRDQGAPWRPRRGVLYSIIFSLARTKFRLRIASFSSQCTYSRGCSSFVGAGCVVIVSSGPREIRDSFVGRFRRSGATDLAREPVSSRGLRSTRPWRYEIADRLSDLRLSLSLEKGERIDGETCNLFALEPPAAVLVSSGCVECVIEN